MARRYATRMLIIGVLFAFLAVGLSAQTSKGTIAGTITDPSGASSTYAAAPKSLPVSLDLGDATRVTVAARYYVHVIATLGTLAEREADEVGDAVFGRPSESNSLGSLGRLMFRAVLQVSDYLQSVSAEARSRRTAGADILRR